MDSVYQELKLKFPESLLNFAQERDSNRKVQKERTAILKTALSVNENEIEDYAETFDIPCALPTNIRSVVKVRKSAAKMPKKIRPKKAAVEKKTVKKRGRLRKVPQPYESGAWD